MAIASKVKTLATKGFDKAKAAKVAASTALMTGASLVMPVFCDLNLDNYTEEGFIAQIAKVVCRYSLYFGIFLILAGLIQLGMSLMSDRPDEKRNAMGMFATAAVFVLMKFFSNEILAFFGVTVTG